jgi:hypothetical protein
VEDKKVAHAFVDMNDGSVYKSASWSAPAKGVRYNLMDDKSREQMYRWCRLGVADICISDTDVPVIALAH